MQKLSLDHFMKARDFVFTASDEINRAWFRYNFEDQNMDRFMDSLAKHQHANGGFGGLFYEFDYQGPCLKSTEVAIKYILDLKEKPSADHPVIPKMMQYILERYHPEIGNWGDPAEPEVNNSVHNHWVRIPRRGYHPNRKRGRTD